MSNFNTGSEIQWSRESKIIAQSCFLSKALRHISMAAQCTYSKLMILCLFPLPCSIFILTFNYIYNLLSGTINQQWGNGVLFLFLYNLPVALGRILNEIRNTKYFRFIESYKKVHKVQQYSLLFPSIPGPSLFLLSPPLLFRTPIQQKFPSTATAPEHPSSFHQQSKNGVSNHKAD